MLKVMHILNSRQFSGAENVIITIINSTKEQIDSVYVSPQGPIKDYLDENNIQFFPVEKLSYKEVKRALNAIKPDIIHAHDFTAGIMSAITVLTLLSSMKTIPPIINHLHNNSPWIKHYGLYSFIYALSCLRYRKILTVSDSVMNEYVFGKFFRNKTEVIGNPIDIDRIRRLAGETQKTAIKPYDISFLGRFSPQKNPFLFLDIVAEVKRKIPDLSVIMIGDGEMREEVEKKIVELRLEENTKIVGFQKNPFQFLSRSKLMCMPSSWEGFGLAAVEALALGLPVICSGAGGLPRIVNNACGAVCGDVDGIDSYAREIINLLENKELWLRKSENAKKRAEEMSNMDNYKDKILKIYATVLGKIVSDKDVLSF